MGYLYLIFSCLCNAAKGFAGKKISFATNTVNDASFFYGLRMIITALIGAILVLIFDGINGFLVTPRDLLLSGIAGLAFALNCLLWIFAQRKGAYAICDALLVASALFPILLSYFIFKETISLWDVLGYLFVVVGCFIVVLYNKQINKKITITLIIIYLFYMLTFGVWDFTKKIFDYDCKGGATTLSANGFTFYSFVFASVVFIIMYFITFKKESFQYQRSIFWKEMPYVVITATLTYAYAYLLVLASSVPATIQYPLKNSLGLILNIIMAFIFFKEKPTPWLFVGIGIIVASLVVIAIF